jgi:hypothetical protein
MSAPHVNVGVIGGRRMSPLIAALLVTGALPFSRGPITREELRDLRDSPEQIASRERRHLAEARQARKKANRERQIALAKGGAA